MLKRTLTGALYCAVIVGFFLVRQYVDTKLFNVLIGIFAIIGCYEVGKMVKKFAIEKITLIATLYGLLFTVSYFLFQYFIFKGKGSTYCLILTAIAIMGVAVYGILKKAPLNKILVSLLPLVYPTTLLLFMFMMNDINNFGFMALVLLFVISPCTDVMAYLGGMAYNKIRKGKAKKLAPHLSPKKTVAGALFGLIGGALGGLIVYYLVGSPANIQVKFFSQEVMFLLIGAICSVLTQVGDLFESYIKRQAGVKDSGKLLPGHGGILDRIDGTMFTAVFIYFLFTL